MNPEPKSIFASKGVLGGIGIAALFAALGLFGIHLDKDQTLGFIDGVVKLWPVILGVVSGVVIMWSRIKHVNFSQVNWVSVIGTVGTLLSTYAANPHDIQHIIIALINTFGAAGVDVHDMQTLIAGVGEIQVKAPALALSGLALYSALFAKKPVVIKRAEPIP